MPTWAWVLSYILAACAALLMLAALALAFVRFHYFLEWRGEWNGGASGSSGGTARVETHFFWYRHVWEPLKDNSWSVGDLFSEEDEGDGEVAGQKSAPETAQADSGMSDPEPAPEFSPQNGAQNAEDPTFLKSSGPSPRRPEESRRAYDVPPYNKKKADPNRKRRALFRLITDRDAWKLAGRYGLKILRLVLRLLKPRIEAAVGHPDPAFLGRVAGKWYAARPLLPSLLPVGRTDVYFRFQDRHPSLWVRVQGGFSALSVVGFGVRLVVAFPFILLARRGLHSWRRHKLTGWRAWVYRKLQASG